MTRTGSLILLALLGSLAILTLPPTAALADPDKDESGHGREDDREGRGGEGRGRGGSSELRKDLDERDRELRQATAERDRELRQASEEADREGKPERYEEKSRRIWAKYPEKRERILARFDEKHGRADDRVIDGRGDRDGRAGRDGRVRENGREDDRKGEDDRQRDEARRRDDGAAEFPRDERRDNLLKKLANVDAELDKEYERHEARMAELRRTYEVRTDRGREGAAKRALAAMREEDARHAKRLGELERRREELRLALGERELLAKGRRRNN